MLLISRLTQLLFLVSIIVSLAGVASAYTVVMRNGRQVEISRDFTVTATTLTYEVSPGFQVTLLMSAIDVAATERANGEPAGSLFGKISNRIELPESVQSQHIAPESKSSRSITNLELESIARVRLESERAYEKRLKDLGLPPMAVLRAEAAAEAERSWQEFQRNRAEKEAKERAAELEARVALLTAQLNQIQANIGQPQVFPESHPNLENYPNFGSYPIFGGYPIYGNYPIFDSYPLFGTFARSRVNPALFRVPFGLPIGGAFGSFNVTAAPPGYLNLRRGNVFGVPGMTVRGRPGFGRRSHRPRHRW